LALSRKGKFRTWLTKIYRRRGSSESSGATSPASDRNGAPKRCRAVGVFSSEISYLVCCEMSSRFRSRDLLVLFAMLPVGGMRTMLLLASQNGSLWWHRHHRELGVGSVSSCRSRSLCDGCIGLVKARNRGLGRHGGRLCSTVELDGRWGIRRHLCII
jgi:hypothetical protein